MTLVVAVKDMPIPFVTGEWLGFAVHSHLTSCCSSYSVHFFAVLASPKL